jgi:prophage regulatory protein
MMTQVLRKRAVADRVGVCVRTLERWERLGLFPARVKLGPNTTGWTEDDLEEWLRTRDRVQAKATPLKAGGSNSPGKDA